MNTILNLIIGFFKIILLLIGVAMLIGGGSCAAMMLLSFGSYSLGDMGEMILMVAILIAWLGWRIIKAVNTKKPPQAIENLDQNAEDKSA